MWVTASFADHAEEARVIFQQELNWDLCRKKIHPKGVSWALLQCYWSSLQLCIPQGHGHGHAQGLTSLCVSWGRVWISKQGYSFTSGQKVQSSSQPKSTLNTALSIMWPHIFSMTGYDLSVLLLGGTRWVIPGEECCLQVLLAICYIRQPENLKTPLVPPGSFTWPEIKQIL